MCKPVYVFRNLEPGDIILTSTGSKQSLAIRAFTLSPYSHAAIATGPISAIEAVGKGVRYVAIRTKATRSLKRIRVLRPDVTNDAPEGIGRKAALKAELFHARGYWLSGAAFAPIKGLGPTEKNSLFCSHLVASAYSGAGLNLVGGVAAHKIIPGMLLKSPYLRDVTDQVMEGPIPYNWVQYDLIEKKERTSIADVEVAVRRAIVKRLKKVFKRNGLPTPSDMVEVMRTLRYLTDPTMRADIDTAFVRALNDEGYVDLPERCFGNHPMTTLDKRLEVLLADDMPTTAIDELLHGYENVLMPNIASRLESAELECRAYANLQAATGCSSIGLIESVQKEYKDRLNKQANVISNCVTLLKTRLPPP